MSGRLPGAWLLALAARIVDRASLESVIVPTLADLQHEFRGAGASRLVRWRVCVVGYVAFIRVVLWHCSMEETMRRVNTVLSLWSCGGVRVAPRSVVLSFALLVTVGLATAVTFGCSGRVIARAASPDGRAVAVCQERPVFDGPDYEVRLEARDGSVIRQLYRIGDGDPCGTFAWSADGRTLAVLTPHVARIRFVDVGWALAHPAVETRYWSWRQVDIDTGGRANVAVGIRFVGPQEAEVDTCERVALGQTTCAQGHTSRRFVIPRPIVTARLAP